MAARIGLPPAVVERARAARHGQGGALGEALAALEAERARLAAERDGAAAAARGGAERPRRGRGPARRRRAPPSEEAAARLGDAVAEELEAARDEVADLLASLQAQPTVRKATEAAAQLDAWKAQVGGATKVAETKAATADRGAARAARSGPACGSASPRSARRAQVLEVDGKQALVQAGPLKVRRPLADLVPAHRAGPAGAPRPSPPPSGWPPPAEARPDAPRLADRRLDVRGLRVEELLREVERFLDRLYAEGERDCLVLHGHGTGALKQALRDSPRRVPLRRELPAGRPAGGRRRRHRDRLQTVTAAPTPLG